MSDLWETSIQERILAKLTGSRDGNNDIALERVGFVQWGGSTIKLSDGGGAGNPDMSIKYKRTAYPPSVYEAAVSQFGEKLPATAEQRQDGLYLHIEVWGCLSCKINPYLVSYKLASS